MNRQQRRAAEKRHKKALRKGAPAANDPAGQAAFVQSRLVQALEQHKSGDLVSAETAYHEVIKLRPDIAAAHNALGALYNTQGRHEDALKCFDAALEIDPSLDEVKKNRRNTLSLLGRDTSDAPLSEDSLDQADDIFIEANALRARGELKPALEKYQQVIKLNPAHARAYANMGLIFEDTGNYEMAETLIESSLVFEPENAGSYNALGMTYLKQGKITESIESFTKSLDINDSNVNCLVNLGNAYKDAGQMHQALSSYRKALDIGPMAEAHTNILFAMNYLPEFDQKTILEEHRRWNESFAAPLYPEDKQFENSPDPDRRLRVGFLSGSFRRHPVGFLTVSAMEAICKDRFELYFYNNSIANDELTKRFRAIADSWQSIVGKSDEDLAEKIERDEIDIMIDLAGHSDGFRLLALARRPAPVQVKWVGGQFNTSGMDAIDYFLSDRVETPEGVDAFYTEEIVRLPDGYVCFDPPKYTPKVGPLPAQENGVVTFGCFNNITKVTPETIELWAKILKGVEGSRIVLKSKALKDAGVCDQFVQQFISHGIAKDRIELRGSSPHHELLSEYNDIDIGLDPFPYSGGLTTVEALYMGVPVITKPGETFASRHAASHITNAGLEDWVCDTFDSYVDLAISKAGDLNSLADMRAGLREQVQNSPLCDSKRFAKNFETALRDLWKRWCLEQA